MKTASRPGQRINFIIPKDLHRRVKIACAVQGTTITNEVIRLLRAEFDRKKRGNTASANEGDTASAE